MGALFSLFKKDELQDFDYHAWKESKPDADGMQLYEQVGQLMEQTGPLLHDLEHYQPCADYIRRAMNNNATEDDEFEAFEAVTKNAEVIYSFYKFSKQLEVFVPKLLSTMALATEANQQPLLSQQAIAKRLAEVLEFVLTFDQLKMLRPGLQNDFSFYRRSLGKHAQDPDLLVKDDDASFISLFLAAHIPMMTTVAKAASNAFQEDETITSGVASFINACWGLLARRKFPADDKRNNTLCLKAMVGGIVLYDHVEPEGAFHSRSPIRMKHICKLLHNQFLANFPQVLADPENEMRNLKGAIRFSTLHFNDDSTPNSYANYLE